MKKFEAEEILNWRNLKLKKFEAEEILSWRHLNLKKFEVEELSSGRNLKMKKFEVEEIWSWRNFNLKKFEVWIWGSYHYGKKLCLWGQGHTKLWKYLLGGMVAKIGLSGPYEK